MVRPSKKTQIPNLQEAIKETAWKQIAETGRALARTGGTRWTIE